MPAPSAVSIFFRIASARDFELTSAMRRVPSISIQPSTVLSHSACFLLPRFFQEKRTPVSLSSASHVPGRLGSLERQTSMSLAAMLADLPKHCAVGTKRNAKGHTTSWIGYKLHLDVAD